jgi:hypothetical protein
VNEPTRKPDLVDRLNATFDKMGGGTTEAFRAT